MGAYLATPPLPWAYNQGGVIILRDKYVSLQDIIDGAVVFEIQDNHGSISNATVVQYPSDQKYYLQASGSMLWQLGDISQAVNRIELIATGNIPQGFSIVGVTVQDLPEPATPTGEIKAIDIGDDYVVGVKMSDDSYAVVVVDNAAIITSDSGAIDFTPTPYNGSDFESIDQLPTSDIPAAFKQVTAQYVNENGLKLDFGNVKSDVIAVEGDNSPVYIAAA